MRLRVSDEDRGRQVRGRGETRWKQEGGHEGGASNSKIVWPTCWSHTHWS
jgi:hypothetical protein